MAPSPKSHAYDTTEPSESADADPSTLTVKSCIEVARPATGTTFGATAVTAVTLSNEYRTGPLVAVPLT